MSYQIKFENPAKEFIYTGRNGVGACHGIDIFPIIDSKVTPQKVIIAPINSKGNIANCDMQFPVSEIENIITALRSIKMQAQMSGIQLTGTVGAPEPAFPD